MMFILRSLFWITLVLVLLPSEPRPEQRSANVKETVKTISTTQALNAAQDTFSDLSGFCGRNAHVCDASGTAIDMLQRKAKYAVRMVYQWAQYRPDQNEPLTPRQSADLSKKQTKPATLKEKAPVRVSELAGPLITGTVKPRPRPQLNKARSGNTLRIDDMIPEWRGPRKPSRA